MARIDCRLVSCPASFGPRALQRPHIRLHRPVRRRAPFDAQGTAFHARGEGGSADAAGFDPLGRALGQFGRGPERELVLEVFEVGFDRLDAPRQSHGDLTRGPALADQPEHLQFAIAERADRRVRIKRAPTEVALGQTPLEYLAHVSFAGERASDSAEHSLVELLFGDISEGAGAQRSLGIDLFVMHRKNERRNARIASFDFLDEIQTVLASEQQIHDHQVGAICPDRVQRGCACADRREDGKARFGLDEGCQPPTEDGVIVDDEKRLRYSFGQFTPRHGHRQDLRAHHAPSAGERRRGKAHATNVPPLGSRFTVKEPPIARALYAIVWSPIPS